MTMTSRDRRSMIALLLLAVVPPRPASAALFHHELETVFSAEAAHGDWIFPFDDARADTFRLFTVRSSRMLCEEFTNGARVAVWDNRCRSDGKVIGFQDVTGDGKPDILVQTGGERDSFVVECYDPWNQPSHVKYTLGPFLTGGPPHPVKPVGQVDFVGSFDLCGDGSRQVLLATMPYGWWGEQRRLWVFDGSTGARRWTFDLGGQVGKVLLVTRKKGSERHLIVSTYAPSNPGFDGGPIDNSHSYIFSLTPGGQLEWKLQAGFDFSNACMAAGDLDGDGEDELVGGLMWGSPGNGDRDRPHLFLIDPATGAITRSAPLPFSVRCIYVDPDHSGRPGSILVGSRNDAGGLYCFDGELKQRWGLAHTRADLDILGVASLEPAFPRVRQVVVLGPENVSVVDLRGKFLCQEPVTPSMHAGLLHVLGHDRLAISGGENRRLYDLAPPLVRSSSVAGILVAICAGVAAGWMVRAKRRLAAKAVELTRAERAKLAQIRAGEEMVDALAAYHHGGHSFKHLRNLKLHLANWERLAGAESAERAAARATCEAYRGTLFRRACRTSRRWPVTPTLRRLRPPSCRARRKRRRRRSIASWRTRAPTAPRRALTMPSAPSTVAASGSMRRFAATMPHRWWRRWPAFCATSR